jgi:hypothetical protein
MTKKRKVLVATAGSLVLLMAAVGVIAVFGFTPTPKFASLKDQPDSSITGTVAFLKTNENGDSCLYVTPASGGDEHQIRCSAMYGPMTVAFTKDGDLVLSAYDYQSNGQLKYDVLDGKTYQQKETFSVADQGAVQSGTASDPPLFTNSQADFGWSSGGANIFSRSGDGAHTTWVARDQEGHDRLLSRKAPANYEFVSAEYSPDQQWFMVKTSHEDLLIGDKQGRVRRLIKGDGGGDFYFAFGRADVAWFQPGQTAGTVNVEDLKKPASQPRPDAELSRSYVQAYPL